MEIDKYNEETFEKIKHTDEEEMEYWLARELMIVLEYKKWQKLLKKENKLKIE